MVDVANRTALITGGANGIGLGIARALARAGARLALIDRDTAALERAGAELSAHTDVFMGALDVRDREAYAQIADQAEAQLGHISLLINNAGVAGGAPAERLTYDLWDWGMGINLDGVINGIQTLVPRMLARGGGGHIVNTASAAGLIAGAGNVLYCTAKFAVVGLSEALRSELKDKNIGVSVLCPGPVATDIVARTRAFQPKVTKTMSPEQRSRAFANNEAARDRLAKGAHPDDVGEMVLSAIRSNCLYVHTDRIAADLIPARAAQIIGSMPAAL